MKKDRISVIIPVYYNRESLKELYGRLSDLSKSSNIEMEIVFVDDGSGDDSFEIISSLASFDNRITAINFPVISVLLWRVWQD
jgi:dolichol-phosphate mannosyltransferase